MTCPDCGYMMTAFDLECTRCAKVGKPRPPEPVIPPEPLPAEKENFSGASNPFDSPLPISTPPRSLKSPLVVVGIVAALIAAYAFGTAHYAQQKSMNELSDLKKQGFVQCSAGDVEGCHYYIDKLRDHGNAEDGEYLKARMIFAEFLNNSSALEPEGGDFSRNEFSSERLKSVADLAAVEGYRSAMDAAVFLADNPVPAGFPPLPPNETQPVTPVAAVPLPVAPVVAPAFSMKTKAGGGSPPYTSAFK